MARSRTPTTKLGSRQKLARQKSLDYVRRLGLRKAAAKLETGVTTLRKWLDNGFPKEKLDLAIGLGKPGGTFSYVFGSKVEDLIKKRGLRTLSTLTGVPQKEIKAQKGRKRIRVRRDKLAKLIKSKGAKATADLFGAKPDAVRRASKVPTTQATGRLKKFVKQYGIEQTTKFLGVSQKTITGWFARNIPSSWEALINQKIGRRTDQGPEKAEVEKERSKADVEREIKKALEKAARWNSETKNRRFHISRKNAEKWARLGTFEEKLVSARMALAASKEPPPKRKPRPKKPPRRAPSRPVIPPEALPPGGLAPVQQPPPAPGGGEPPEKPPKPPKPPKKPPEMSGDLPEDFRQQFMQARAEAFFEGRYPKPEAPWNYYRKWRLIYREGVSVYKKIEKFVRDVDLDKLGTQVIETAKKIWTSVVTTNSTLMTIRLVMSVMGEGNPFYPDAFIAGNKVNFVTRNLKIVNEYDIEADVRALMEEVYVVDNENPLFLEYTQTTKSNNITNR